jgi:uncharacterized protein (DUF1015 family)
MRIRPFAALRPLPNLASRVAAPPYDVVDTAEARRLADGNPYCFLRVSRAEIELPPGTDPHDDDVYERAAQNLRRFVGQGILVRDSEPRIYIYRLVSRGRSQHGIVCCCHVDDYERNVIRRHEHTRPDKEQDRTRHILAVGAHTGPVLLAYRDLPEIEALVQQHVNARPLFHFDAPDGVTHTIWTAPDGRPYQEAFAAMEAAYVADGHHRAAAALRAARERRRDAGAGTVEREHDWFLAALFPSGQLTILPYNRVVKDLGGRSPTQILADLRRAGRLTPTVEAEPGCRGAFCVYLERRWHRLELDPASIDRAGPVASLDVALLQDRVLGPILGIADQRTDPRLEFVGGIHGTEALRRRVDCGAAAIAFSLHPTAMEQLLAVADAGSVMPPKSTWFEPKLRSGLLVHEIGC